MKSSNPPKCLVCKGTGTLKQKRNGAPIVCRWCDPSRKRVGGKS